MPGEIRRIFDVNSNFPTWVYYTGITFDQLLVIIRPAKTKLKGGYTGFTSSVCLSICLWTKSCLLCIIHNTTWFHFIFANIIKQLSEGVSHVKVIVKIKNLNFYQIFRICNFDFVLLWHGIWYGSIIWVIMGRRGVFSECRRSSCSSSFEYWVPVD